MFQPIKKFQRFLIPHQNISNLSGRIFEFSPSYRVTWLQTLPKNRQKFHSSDLNEISYDVKGRWDIHGDMTFKVIWGQGQGQEMTSVPTRDYFIDYRCAAKPGVTRPLLLLTPPGECDWMTRQLPVWNVISTVNFKEISGSPISTLCLVHFWSTHRYLHKCCSIAIQPTPTKLGTRDELLGTFISQMISPHLTSSQLTSFRLSSAVKRVSSPCRRPIRTRYGWRIVFEVPIFSRYGNTKGNTNLMYKIQKKIANEKVCNSEETLTDTQGHHY